MKKKIVIFRNGSYGDGLVAIPCLKLIKLNNMQSDIHYLTLQNNDTRFFNPKKLFSKFELNFKFKVIDKRKFYIINFINYFFQNRFDEMYYLKEEPTCFGLKNSNNFFKKINIFLEKIFFKILFIKKIIGLEHKNFINNFPNKKESVRLIKRFYYDIVDENQIISLFKKKI